VHGSRLGEVDRVYGDGRVLIRYADDGARSGRLAAADLTPAAEGQARPPRRAPPLARLATPPGDAA
jgi:hypothetical protein